MYIGLSGIAALMIGSTEINAAYIGPIQVYRKYGSELLTASNTTSWTAPTGVVKVKVSMVGGGGSGSGGEGASGNYYGGGLAGMIYQFMADVVPGTVYPITMGQGASGWYCDGDNVDHPGQDGTDTVFLGKTAAGGHGGTIGGSISVFKGNGEAITKCGVTKNNGITSGSVAFGGESSYFWNGGNGKYDPLNDVNSAGDGNMGSGGGAACYKGSGSTSGIAYTGYGGDGAIKIEWGTTATLEGEYSVEAPRYSFGKTFDGNNYVSVAWDGTYPVSVGPSAPTPVEGDEYIGNDGYTYIVGQFVSAKWTFTGAPTFFIYEGYSWRVSRKLTPV